MTDGSPPPTPEALQASLVDHVGVPLWRASRAWNDRMMARLAAAGFDDLTPAHAQLLPHLDLGGTRITVLAERAGLTKQAIGQTVQELEGRGYVERTPDPADARAKIVRYTARGLAFVAAGQAVKRAMQAEAEAALGAAGLRRLEADLARLLAVLEGDAAP